jgi:hypothetical protein
MTSPDLAAAVADENPYALELAATARQALNDSYASACAPPQGAYDVSAAAWFGTIAVHLSMLSLIAAQVAGQTGTALTGLEKIALAEAAAVRSLKTPEELNSWLAARKGDLAVPHPRAFDAAPFIYATALGVARAILRECLHILERVGGHPFASPVG